MYGHLYVARLQHYLNKDDAKVCCSNKPPHQGFLHPRAAFTWLIVMCYLSSLKNYFESRTGSFPHFKPKHVYVKCPLKPLVWRQFAPKLCDREGRQ